ncbi:cytochrome P450 [Fomitopsis serialis]|uniref:cytochrome P450 n=1 Tax=Fomitopsis serialis TaxID=139415 RepID=UPI0020079BD6|nr:cytochrome P450 [Neoantrodia serialis]KAH9922942.1 cytochrome P450 [Neoantrodia serialis]
MVNQLLLVVLSAPLVYLLYLIFIQPRYNPLRNLPGPPSKGLFRDQLGMVMNPSVSPRTHEHFVKTYGRNVMIRGILPWDLRLFTLDPLTLAHVMKHSHIYEKPWQSRRLITGLIGCGMLAAEGAVHKRQRRVATPAFSVQNMRELVPLVFAKGDELKEKWLEMVREAEKETEETGGLKLDVCHWVSRATFDVIGSAGFDYQFNAIQNETNELFSAYKEMFEVAVSQQSGALWGLAVIYLPILETLFLLAITWMLYLMARYPDVQARLRAELLSLLPPTPLSALTPDEVSRLYAGIAELKFLENVIREAMRLIPPVHSSARVATRDDVLPAATPVRTRMPDGSTQEVKEVRVPKGAFIHVPVEGFNLDREVWGPDGWAFKPDRWDNLPEAVVSQPGLYNNTLTFSAGPRACIGLRFSIIEIKTFLFILLTHFTFAESDEKVGKANVVLTRPYVIGKHMAGSQCPLLVTPYVPEGAQYS